MGFKNLDDIARDLRSLPDDIEQAVTAHLRDNEARPLAQAMSSRARTRMARRAAGTVRFTPTTAGGSVRAGGGSSLGTVLFAGSEYGSRGTRRIRYSRRSKNGGAHVVRRRTTRMFNPWVGTRGYWFWPTARRQLRGLVGRTAEVLEQEVNQVG